jgi:hypothetical protein
VSARPAFDVELLYREQMAYYIHRYRGSGNLGDAIQSLALERLLPPVEYAWRDDGLCAGDGTFVVNGWLGQNTPPVDRSNCLFAGVFVNDTEANYQWMANSAFPEIGARDPATVAWCADRGIRATFIGCATLTYDFYDGPRSGAYAVDAEYPGAQELTHGIGPIPWADQREQAIALLARYQTASLVITTRLHVALPCLAFGTPVLIRDPIGRDRATLRRFSILDALGVCYGIPQVMDVSDLRKRYVGFIARSLGIEIPHDLARHSILPSEYDAGQSRVPR